MVRAFSGRDASGKPRQVSANGSRNKNGRPLAAAEPMVAPSGRAAGSSDVLEAWVRKHDATWAPASRRDQLSRVARINGDRIARSSVARLSIEDMERWHARLQDEGLANVSIRNIDGVLRAALTQAVRWGWITRNPLLAVVWSETYRIKGAPPSLVEPYGWGNSASNSGELQPSVVSGSS